MQENKTNPSLLFTERPRIKEAKAQRVCNRYQGERFKTSFQERAKVLKNPLVICQQNSNLCALKIDSEIKEWFGKATINLLSSWRMFYAADLTPEEKPSLYICASLPKPRLPTAVMTNSIVVPTRKYLKTCWKEKLFQPAMIKREKGSNSPHTDSSVSLHFCSKTVTGS